VGKVPTVKRYSEKQPQQPQQRPVREHEHRIVSSAARPGAGHLIRGPPTKTQIRAPARRAMPLSAPGSLVLVAEDPVNGKAAVHGGHLWPGATRDSG